MKVFLLRIPVDNFRNEKLYNVYKDIDISQSESIELLNKLFECNKLFRKYEPMEMSFMLKLCINKNKRWWFSSLFKSVNPDMGSYFSAVSGVFINKAIQLIHAV